MHDATFATVLRHELDAPIFNRTLKKWVGRGDLDYERYLRTSELLGLQTRRDQLVHHDELLFQIAHQAQELWLRLIACEIAEMLEDLDLGRLWQASARAPRVLRALRCIALGMSVLETMPPGACRGIRRRLGDCSGQESPGYNAVRLAADALGEGFERLLVSRHLTPRDLYLPRGGDTAADLARLAEQLLDIDQAFQSWQYAPFQRARRTIGVGCSVSAPDGFPAHLPSGSGTERLFPALWDARVQLTAECKRGESDAPGADGGGSAIAGE